jgi:acetylornithine deacetylase
MKSAIDRYIEDHKEQLIDLIQQAVRIPSVVGNEGKMQNFMTDQYKALGLQTESFVPNKEAISMHDGFVDSAIPFSESRPNVLGMWKGDSSERSLTLNGHVDVVSAEPLDRWTYDPWGGIVEGSRLYGRGAGDMKAGLLANYFALKTVLDLGMEPKGTVMLQSVIEEEAGGGGGTLACLLKGYVTDGFIATEPHYMNICIAHAGILYFKVRVVGRTAHAGQSHLGVSAIRKIIPIYQALQDLSDQRAADVKYDLFAKGSGQASHFNIGMMKAGDWPSSVAGEAELQCRIGFVPGETRDGIKQLIEKTVREAVGGDEWLQKHPPVVQWFGWQTDPWVQETDHPYVQSLKSTAAKYRGDQLEFIGRASGNDARFTRYVSKPGVCFGPVAYNIHGPDEYVDLDSVLLTAKVLATHIVDWCGIKE